jgi:hypothetical protein
MHGLFIGNMQIKKNYLGLSFCLEVRMGQPRIVWTKAEIG